jgi:hypothetical protein
MALLVCAPRSLSLSLSHVHAECGRTSVGRGEAPSENRLGATQLYAFALVVCRRRKDGKYLLVQEAADRGYWLPGGRVDGLEGLTKAGMFDKQYTPKPFRRVH